MKRILVVDDSVINLKVVEGVLKKEYELFLVGSGEEALECLRKQSVDLVLLDLHMPKMNGFETIERIRQLENNQDVPVIFLTADSDADSEITGLNMGAMDFIKKPFVPEVMCNRIKHVLQLEELTKNLEERVEEKTNQIEQLSFEIISTIVSMIEAKDSYTKGHSIRVAEYSILIAKELGWTEDEIQNLKYIALLHDIGKIGIPDSVLNKPGKLTDIEYNIIKAHTTIGGEILKDIKTITDVDSGAKYHHERYDGKGYPCGLCGEDIPLVARIICIADAYDAMNSKRIYRDSLCKEYIRRELVDGRGTQFDPSLLDIFLTMFDEGILLQLSATAGKERRMTSESTMVLEQIAENVESVQEMEHNLKRNGLLSRKQAEVRIVEAMKEAPGCMALIDLDNLKRTNDTLGHLAGDYALETVSDVFLECSENAIMTRIGGDEFLYYLPKVGREEAEAGIELILQLFQAKKEEEAYLAEISLSIGLCTSIPQDSLNDVVQRADKALYHVKQSGKCGYFFYNTDVRTVKQASSVDLKKIVENLTMHDINTEVLSVEYRGFAKMYEYIHQLVKRYEYSMQLIMITVEPVHADGFDIEEKEYAMYCMEKTLQATLRAVDVSVRYSGEQFLVVLLNAKKDDITVIMNRVFERFYKVYACKPMHLSYDVAELLH